MIYPLLAAGLGLSVGCSGGVDRMAVADADQVAPEGCTLRLRSLGGIELRLWPGDGFNRWALTPQVQENGWRTLLETSVTASIASRLGGREEQWVSFSECRDKSQHQKI